MTAKKTAAASKSRIKNLPENHTLEDRKDLYDNWIIRSWFTTGVKWASLKRIFFELFGSLYDDLLEKFEQQKVDDIFNNFINVIFPSVLDVYKWYESEKVSQDVGLLKSLESIALCDWYIDLLTSYSKKYNSMQTK